MCDVEQSIQNDWIVKFVINDLIIVVVTLESNVPNALYILYVVLILILDN